MASATCRLLQPAACIVLMRAKVGGSMGGRPFLRQKVFRGLTRLAFVVGSVALTCSIRTLSHAAARVCLCHTLSTTLLRCTRVSVALYEHNLSLAGHPGRALCRQAQSLTPAPQVHSLQPRHDLPCKR